MDHRSQTHSTVTINRRALLTTPGPVKFANTHAHNKLLAGGGRLARMMFYLETRERLLNELRSVNEPEKARASVKFLAFEKLACLVEKAAVLLKASSKAPVNVVILEVGVSVFVQLECRK